MDIATGHVQKMRLPSSYVPTYGFSELAWIHARI